MVAGLKQPGYQTGITHGSIAFHQYITIVQCSPKEQTKFIVLVDRLRCIAFHVYRTPIFSCQFTVNHNYNYFINLSSLETSLSYPMPSMNELSVSSVQTKKVEQHDLEGTGNMQKSNKQTTSIVRGRNGK